MDEVLNLNFDVETPKPTLIERTIIKEGNIVPVFSRNGNEVSGLVDVIEGSHVWVLRRSKADYILRQRFAMKFNPSYEIGFVRLEPVKTEFEFTGTENYELYNNRLRQVEL